MLRRQNPVFKAVTWLSLIGYALQPQIRLPALPEGVIVGDIVFVGAIIIALPQLLSSRVLVQPRHPTLMLAYSLYIALIILLPLIGLILIPSVEPAMVLGDLRWAAFAILLLLLLQSYAYSRPGTAQRDTYRAVWILVIAQLPFLTSQAAMSLANQPANELLINWYPTDENVYGFYGQHINRYAGSFGYPSGLALLGGAAVLLGVFRGLFRSPWNLALTVVGASYIIASGNRAMMLGIPAAVLLVAILQLPTVRPLRTIRFRRLRLRHLWYPTLVVLSVWGAIAAFESDIGRIASSNRLEVAVDWLTGTSTFEEASGRGASRWSAPIIMAREVTPVGTLANPVHVLSELPAFDSYFVFMIAQAGPFLIASFVLFALIWAVSSIQLTIEHNRSGPMAVALLIAILISSVTQNTMTGQLARFMVTAAIFILSVRHAPRASV